MLQSKELTYRKHMAVQYRWEQRQILQEAMRLITARRDTYLESLSASNEFQPRNNFVFPLMEIIDKSKVEQWQNKFIKHDQKQNNALFEVPSRYLITCDTIMSSNFGELIAQNEIELDPEILIALFLIKQKHSDSTWKEFLGKNYIIHFQLTAKLIIFNLQIYFRSRSPTDYFWKSLRLKR